MHSAKKVKNKKLELYIEKKKNVVTRDLLNGTFLSNTFDDKFNIIWFDLAQLSNDILFI